MMSKDDVFSEDRTQHRHDAPAPRPSPLLPVLALPGRTVAAPAQAAWLALKAPPRRLARRGLSQGLATVRLCGHGQVSSSPYGSGSS